MINRTEKTDIALSLRSVSRSFGEVQAIGCLDMEVAKHEFVAIVGPSGCGKTTLLNLLAGFDTPTSGTVERQGAVRTIYQQGGLYPWLTVEENIGLGLRRMKNSEERQDRLKALLALIEMEKFAVSYPHQLSGGMRQRVELARALADETDILLMDEPFSALDFLTRLQMRKELGRVLQEQPRTVVFVTHDVEEAVQLADRVVLLSDRPAVIKCEIDLSEEAPRPRSFSHPIVSRTALSLLKEMGMQEE